MPDAMVAVGKFITNVLICFFPLASNCQNPDFSILKSIHSNRDPSADLFFHRFSRSADFIAPAYPVFLAAGGFIKSDSNLKTKALEAGLGLGFSAALAYGLKYSIQRKRPFEEHPEIRPPFAPSASWSFPSGTVSIAFETATSLGLQFRNWKVWTPAFLWAGTVAYSRIRQGEHYPSDVLAGAVLGMGSAWLSHHLGKWVRNKGIRHRRRFGFKQE